MVNIRPIKKTSKAKEYKVKLEDGTILSIKMPLPTPNPRPKPKKKLKKTSMRR